MSDVSFDREPDALPPAVHREAIQELSVGLGGWATLAACAAYSCPATEILEILRGARKTLIVALEEAKELVEIEGDANQDANARLDKSEAA